MRRRHRLLGPVDLTLDAGGLTAVIGPNGSGKTTLLRALHGIERLSDGTLSYGITVEEARQRQSFVFQTPITLRRSLAQNLAYPLQLSGTPRSDIAALTTKWAEEIDLAHAMHWPATRLSGGERQKLALARALITKPELLFLDEPSANLDGRATREIEALLLKTRDAGTRIVMATHDMGQARRLATDALFVLDGRIQDQGKAQEFFETPGTAEKDAFLKGDIVG